MNREEQYCKTNYLVGGQLGNCSLHLLTHTRQCNNPSIVHFTLVLYTRIQADTTTGH